MNLFFERFSVLYLLGLTFLILTFNSCQTEPEFKTTESGLKYRFYVKNDDSVKIKQFDIVEVYMNYRTKDSMIFEGSKTKIPFQVNPVYDGDLMEGILMMHNGDSATFVLDANDFFKKMMQQPSVPEHVGNNNELYFDIKILNVNPEPETVKAERVELENRKDNEIVAIEKFMVDNNLTIQPTASGLYYLELITGKGKQAQPGKKVRVHYDGYFLDGTKFDSSYDRGMPISFVIGNNEVIAGLDEGVTRMKVGGKSKLIIPSKIGYGEEQRGNIKPFTSLIFDIELVEVE